MYFFKRFLNWCRKVLKFRVPFYRHFGAKFELDTESLNNETTTAYQIEAVRNQYGYVFISIIPDVRCPKTRLLLAFKSFTGMWDLGVEYWYYHSLDFPVGSATWHHAGGGAGGDRIFQDMEDEFLTKSLHVLKLSQIDWGSKVFPSTRYLYRAERILEFLSSEKGRAFRKKYSEVRSRWEDRSLVRIVFKMLSRL